MAMLQISKKGKSQQRVYGLQRFVETECPVNLPGTFQDNIRFFLRECAELQDYNVDGMPIWCSIFPHETSNHVLPLYIMEENVEQSPNPYCDHCIYTGWGHHYVSKRKYHFIIPTSRDGNLALGEDALDLQTHLLHGLVHSNGYGHLICINGIEGGSKYACGREIMDFWDRICTFLGVRRISVEDLSKKHSMDLRLLYGVAYGHPWFGLWGYKFRQGSYGVTEHIYQNALKILRSLTLDEILLDHINEEIFSEIKRIFEHYRAICQAQLTTLSDLLSLMLIVRSSVCQQKKLALPTSIIGSSVGYIYPDSISLKNDIQNTKTSRFKKLGSVGTNLGKSRRVRSVTYTTKPGKRGLIQQEVRVSMYAVPEHGKASTLIGSSRFPRQVMFLEDKTVGSSKKLALEDDLLHDLVFLYENILLNYPNRESMDMATQAVLYSKCFIKKWSSGDDKPKMLRINCSVDLDLVDLKPEQIKKLPPGVSVALPLLATVRDLKDAIQFALRDTYCIMENFVVTEIKELEEDIEDGDTLYGRIRSGSKITVRGYGLDFDSELKWNGFDTENDRARMMAYDMHHMRGCGIVDSETLTRIFSCSVYANSFADQEQILDELDVSPYGCSEDLLFLEGTEA